MKSIVRMLAVLLLSTVLLGVGAVPLAANASATTDEHPAVVFTEICFNPAFEENDYGLETSADVFEYLELCNRSDTPVSLDGITLARSTGGYDGTYRTMPILPPDGGDCRLDPGEIAVIAIPTADGYAAGLRTETDEDRAAYYRRFADFYGCADNLPSDRFYIADNRDNATGEAYDYGFNLSNSPENVVFRLAAAELLCEVHFSAAEWNRNGYSLNLTWREGGSEGHPRASAPYNLGAYTPGLLHDNQISTDGLTAVGDTMPVRVMQYNICATDSTQTDTDGTPITMDERIGHAFDIIEGYDPDILALCEINYLWVPRLQEEMTGEGCAYAGYGRSSRGATYGNRRINKETWDLFNLILWKTDTYELVEKGTFWCSSEPTRPNYFTWEDGLVGDFSRGINWVILRERATGGEFFVLCAHIDAKVAEARRRSAALIVEMATELCGGRPVLMLGDWNSNERAASYAELVTDGFADARYRIPDPTAMTLYGTTNGWGGYKDFKSRAPIDHCIVTPHNVFVESASMDPGYFDEAEELVSADHNATIFALRVGIHRTSSDLETEPTTEPLTEPDTESVDTQPETNSGDGDTTAPETEPSTELPLPDESNTDAVATGNAETDGNANGGCRSSFDPLLPMGVLLLALVVPIVFYAQSRRHSEKSQ